MDAWRGVLLSGPATLVLMVIVVVAIITFRTSLDRFTPSSGQQSAVTLANWSRLTNDPATVRSLLLTIRLTLITTAVALGLAYPVALFVRFTASEKLRGMLALAMLAPLLTNLVLQIVGWMVIFSPRGPLGAVLPIRIAFTETSVVIVLVHHALPFAFYSIDAALRNVPVSLEEAGATLGGSRWVVLRRIVLPLSLPGLLSGSLLVAATTFSAFVIPILVGGYRVPVLGVLVQGAMDQSNWPMSATIASSLTVVALAALWSYARMTQKAVRRGRAVKEAT